MYNELYVLKYNNYYNREIKAPLPNVTDYQDYIYASLGQTNFNPGDGVATHHDIPLDIDDGDYLIVASGTQVVSRWFIIDHDRVCRGPSAGLYRLQLLRDVIADNYNATLNSTCFIERAIVNDDNPLIYNSENINTNQQRKSAELLKDDTKMAWLIGFVDREAPKKTISINSTVVADYEMSSYRFKDYFNKDANSFTFIDGYVYVTNTQYSASPTAFKFVLDQYAEQTYLGNSTSKGDYKYTDQNGNLKSYIQENGLNLALNISTKHSLYDGISSDSNYNSLLYEEDKIVRDGTDFYKIGIKTETHERTYRITEDKDGEYLLTYLTNFMKNFRGYKSGTPYFEIYIKYDSLRLTKTPIVEGEYTVNYPGKTEHLINKSAPFDVFCIPYADDMKIKVGTKEVQANKQFAMSIASELSRNLGNYCYDIQLLPYCPMTGYKVTDNIFDINSGDAKRRTAIKRGDETVYWMFWSTSNEKSFTIQHPITVSNKKIQNQCEMYRLCSPNYNGQFGFSVAKNEGVDYFNVDITYLPVSSYLHVVPNLKGLYGNYSDNSPIGLICKGEFSINSVKEQYIQFMQNNKNYENIFRAEINTNDKSHELQVEQSRIANWLGAAATGLQTGVFSKGAVGAGLGVGAGIVTGIAGEVDINYGNQLYELNKKYKQDVHNYQLDNIKAMPNSLSKVSSYTKNNQIFVVLERYDATEKEKEAVAQNVIDYSMNVGVIGKPIDYIYNDWSYNGNTSRGYFKAQLIKIDLNTYHESDAISTELARGVYFK